MSQCVPNWDVDDNPVPARLSVRSHSNPIPPDVTILDYEVAELTWENGQLAMHGLGQPRVSLKPQPQQPSSATTLSNKYMWDKLPRATGTGTLESIVNQAATSLPQRKQPLPTFDDLVPWFDRPGATTSATMTMDALVPCTAAAAIADHHQRKLQEQAITARLLNESSTVPPTRVVDCSTHVGSCSGAAAAAALQEDDERKRSRVAAAVRVPVVGAGEWSGRDQHSVSGSATVGRERDSLQMTVDTCEREVYNSVASQDNTSSGDPPCTRATAEEHDSVCHSQSQREAEDEDEKVKRNGKSSVSTKRSRAAAIHNQSERKRRDKINQRMKTLQKLVPNSSKTDKASVLDEVIEYLKQLQAQVQMMNRMNMQPMMLPMAMQQQQQLQMPMMAPMGLGMGMGMGMSMGMGMGMPGVIDLNALARHNLPMMPNATAPILHPMAAAAAPFLPLAPPWDGSGGNGDRLHPNAAAALPDPLSAFLVSQSQPMTLDTYSRMAAMYQQLHQPPASSSKN